MPRYATLAEQYRAHREAFVLALELGCTPGQAEQMLRDRARAERLARLRACGTRAPEQLANDGGADSDFEPLGGEAGAFEAFDCRWMLRG